MGSGGSSHFQGMVTLKGIVFGPSGKILVTHSGNRWSLPGGRLEVGESLTNGLRRELIEECNLDVDVGRVVHAGADLWMAEQTSERMVAVLFRCDTADQDFDLNEEHVRAEWVPPTTAANRLCRSFGEQMTDIVARAQRLGN